MGTKSNPGKYDCYAKAADDEPIFTLRAKDPSAPYFVMMWEAMRRGDQPAFTNLMVSLQLNEDVKSLVSPEDNEKWKEAREVARAMQQWRVMRRVKGNVVPT